MKNRNVKIYFKYKCVSKKGVIKGREGGRQNTFPARKLLFLNFRKKKAKKNVPSIWTSDSNAVLGCGFILGVGVVLFIVRLEMVSLMQYKSSRG